MFITGFDEPDRGSGPTLRQALHHAESVRFNSLGQSAKRVAPGSRYSFNPRARFSGRQKDRIIYRPLRGLRSFFVIGPRAYARGFMLPPASQAVESFHSQE
jgi:hypothetical protein